MTDDALLNFISITANVLTLSATIGLLFGVIIQPRRERSNWAFALFLAVLSLWAFVTLILRIPGLNLFTSPSTALYLHLTSLGLTPVAFYFVVVTFTDIKARPARLLRWVSLPGTLLFLLLLWGRQLAVIDDAALASSPDYGSLLGRFELLPAGYLALAYVVLHIVVAYYFMRTWGNDRSRSLEIPALLLLVGYAANFIPPLSHLPFDTTLATIAAAIMGYTVINHQLFNPLQDMNDQLSRTNRELRSTIAELANEQERTQKLNDELRAASQYKSDFLAKMSHELRTPLNSIVGYSELLMQGLYGDLNDKQSDRLEKIHRNGRDLLALINDILDLSKIEAGRLELSPEFMNLQETIAGLETTFEPLAAEKGLTLAFAVEPDVYPLYADTLRIRQICTNLMSNAIKFTPEGRVSLETYNVDVVNGKSAQINLPVLGWLGDGRWVMVQISDTGIGIPPEHHATIFDEFRQVDDTATREFGGTGLGLAITMKLVEMHSGRIWLKSAVGQGSTFFVALPASSTVTGQPIQEAPQAAGGQSNRQVLIIDDSKEAADILAAYLEEAGYQVIRAVNGETGIRLARKLKPAVITTDILMPGMNGWEVIETLKQDPVTADIPVIVVSIVDQEPKSFSLGASAHVNKPVHRQQLLEVIGRFHQPGRPLPILVVDDNADDREIIGQILSTAAYAVHACSSGQEALDWLAQNQAGLVLLDLMIPELSGFDVLTAIRSRPALADLPVLIVSAKALTPDEEDFLNGRIAAIVKKQEMERTDLLAQIAQFMPQP